jgi:hypothetical protein
MQSRGIPCICRGIGQEHSTRPPSCAKKLDDSSPSECFYLWYYISLLCPLLSVRWHHDYIFSVLLRMWQTQDVNPYMISFRRSKVDHYMLINTHYRNEIKSMRPWWRWWFDTLWMTFTRLWPIYSCHVYLVWPRVTKNGCLQNIWLEFSL